MPEQSAEETAHTYAKAVVSGDFGKTLRLMTVDAFGKSMTLGLTSWRYTSYELIPEGGEGDEQVFVLSLQGKHETVRLRDHFRLIEGEWKLDDIERLE